MTMSSFVDDFYSGQSVFVTGASGFLGKVILEKLLRDCKGVTTIYVLLRSKQGVDPQRRVQELTNSVIFSKVKQQDPLVMNKIVPISGDITFPELGISPQHQRLLGQHVSVVFHVAATIRFDEPLRRAVDINVCGTKRVLDLCKKMPHLKALVHVSTAYCNKTKLNIKESVYEDVSDPERIIQLAGWMDDDLLDSMAGSLFDGRPSSYHYTKALAENVLAKDEANLPTAIVRPSIITASWKEPIPGWIDNYNGPTGYLVVSGKGILRTMYCQQDNICDMVPVDIVANSCILSAVDIGSRIWTGNSNKVKVYNCTSGSVNPISWGKLKVLSDPILVKHPSMEIFRYPGTRFHARKSFHDLNLLIEHTLPASVVDFVFKITGHKPVLAQVYMKVHRTIAALEYFTNNEWTFKNDHQLSLCTDFQSDDVDRFPTDIRKIHWATYMETYILGVRKFLLKEDPSTLPKARAKLERLYYILLMAKISIALGSCHQVWYHYPTIKMIWKDYATPVLKATGTYRFVPNQLRI